MTLEELLAQIRSTPGCKVWPPNGQPQVLPHHILPTDLIRFYQLCGGLELFPGSRDFGILPPDKVSLATPLIRRLEWEDAKENESDDISWDWYVVAHNGNGDYFSIDLSPTRLGRCYDSFYETYAQPGDNSILAYSFTDFLERLFTLVQETPEWEHQLSRLRLGDAYDQ